MGTIRTLVLSGGGGRGAFHAGVYQYLCQHNKPGVSEDHQGVWQPDIVVGTSIGAVNGAAIVQGTSADQLLDFWRSLREQDIEGLPPNMTRITRWFVNRAIKDMIGVPLPTVKTAEATSPTPHHSWIPIPGLGRLGAFWLGRFANLLDTGPLRRTLVDRLKLDETKIAKSQSILLINATNVSTGQRATFSNKPIKIPTSEGKLHELSGDHSHDEFVNGITLKRILASCSIPLIYPWTVDQDNQVYWDGAVVANTPLGVALDAAQSFPPGDTLEVVVVLMTPWRDGEERSKITRPPLPNDFIEAITWVLDWALLASFRERLDLIDAYNRLGRLGRRIGDPELSAIREVRVVIVAPDDFFPAARIIDYDDRTNVLIKLGYEAAEKAFCQHFATEESAAEAEVDIVPFSSDAVVAVPTAISEQNAMNNAVDPKDITVASSVIASSEVAAPTAAVSRNKRRSRSRH